MQNEDLVILDDDGCSLNGKSPNPNLTYDQKHTDLDGQSLNRRNIDKNIGQD